MTGRQSFANNRRTIFSDHWFAQFHLLRLVLRDDTYRACEIPRKKPQCEFDTNVRVRQEGEK